MSWNDMPREWYDDYESGRPGYPQRAVDAAKLSPSATVVDLGAGTGKLTRVLASTFARVVAVEPDDEMRRLLVRLCSTADAVAGTAEQIPLGDQSADAVFAAQSFHWFDNERALSEIVRVLRPHGALVLMWNVPAGGIDPPIRAVEELLRRHWPDGWHLPLDLSASSYTPTVWQLPLARSVFEQHRRARAPNPQKVNAAELVAFFASMGWIAAIADDDRSSLLSQVRSLLTSPEYVLPWETHVQWTRLLR